ncbi:MAG TPA: hypothetical protein VFW98_11060 [Gemmatimonadaceae bacterium]|nr:hypothetical protein [Gemmatimonadaceae bacterium]
MPTTVAALLPLSFLEAVRSVDTPDDDLEAEFVPELRNKRLGLSETVYSQIRRYSEAVRRHERTVHDEAAALARLIGRRPDAAAVFQAAGRYLAREAYLTTPSFSRQLVMTLPALFARPIALRQVRQIAGRCFNGHVRRVGSSLMLEVSRSVTLESASPGVGCVYYEAWLRELLRLLSAGNGVVEHVRCAARGEGACEWRAEWG